MIFKIKVYMYVTLLNATMYIGMLRMTQLSTLRFSIIDHACSYLEKQRYSVNVFNKMSQVLGATYLLLNVI